MIKAPYRESETSVAEPMANPLPIAAVVLPAESNASVIWRTLPPNSHISTIPPALSQIGPNASIASEIARFDNMPRAANEIPNS